MTICGVVLVDRVGRKLLLSIGTAGIIASLLWVGLQFRSNEKLRVDSRAFVQAMVTPNQQLVFSYNETLARALLVKMGGAASQFVNRPTSLVIIYSYGDFRSATKAARSDEIGVAPIEITRANCVPANRAVAFFKNPFGNLDVAKRAPLHIEQALITPLPSQRSGLWVAIALCVFVAFYALGPGVCVWLALSELMPTRIRSNGMSIALLINQTVSTSIAAFFLPAVGKYGYGMVFFGFASFTVIYFVTAARFLPETKGKTLEEIEACFEGVGS
jgi:hypothetical protein